MHSKIGLKRESKEFTDASETKPGVFEMMGESTGVTKATGGRMSIGSVVTPMANAGQNKSSQKTPTQFGQTDEPRNPAKYLDTDEDGNRMSILPDKSRPSSSSKKDTASTNIKPKSAASKIPKKFNAPKDEEKDDAPKTTLDRLKHDIKL